MGLCVSNVAAPRSLRPGELDDRIRRARVSGTLNLSGCRLRELPEAVVAEAGGSLRVLDLSENELERVPEALLARLPRLQRLNLARNRLAALPSLAACTALERLVASENRLEDLGPLPPSLRQLQLADNRLRRIPESVLALAGLVELDVSGNGELRELPAALGNLGGLEVLSADACGLTSLATLPSWRGLARLHSLFLRRNAIRATPEALPASLFTDTRLHKLQFDGNPMTQKQLQVLPGFDAFLARRKERIDRGLRADVGPADGALCGLAP